MSPSPWRVDEGNATSPLHRQHLGEQQFVAAAQAAGDGDASAAESELPRAGRGAKRGECELRASGYPLFLLSRHVRASRSQFTMTSEPRNPGRLPRRPREDPVDPRPPKAGQTTAVINQNVRMPPDTTDIFLAGSPL